MVQLCVATDVSSSGRALRPVANVAHISRVLLLRLPQVVYYIFAMVGMELFKGKVKFYEEDSSDPAKAYCGNELLRGTAFAQLNYCKNNFNNVVSSYILLVELTVVNQWHDILRLYLYIHLVLDLQLFLINFCFLSD